jgi:hypothetical protein
VSRVVKELLVERGWIYAAGICLVSAAIFLARENLNAAFVAATLGVVAWFLNVRNHLKRNVIPADDADDEEIEEQPIDESDEIEERDRG